jgi:anaerobic selenocysteine-containing dehydrogenase
MLLLPAFRLPTLIHSRSGNAKWLLEISNQNPIWIHPDDAQRLEVAPGDLLKVHSAIGYFVDKVWVKEGIRPASSPARATWDGWRLDEQAGGSRWATAAVDLKEVGPGKWKMRQIRGIPPFVSGDPDSQRIWWQDAGVHQNLISPVQPDPVSVQHCWHQKVRLEKAQAGDLYGEIYVDTVGGTSNVPPMAGAGAAGSRPRKSARPLWLARVYRPPPEDFI